jgi:hypothetical protein
VVEKMTDAFVHQKGVWTTESIPQRKKISDNFEIAPPAVSEDEIGAQGGGGDVKNKHKIAIRFPPEKDPAKPARRA